MSDSLTNTDNSGVPPQLRQEMAELMDQAQDNIGNTVFTAPQEPAIVDPLIPIPGTIPATPFSVNPEPAIPKPNPSPEPSPITGPPTGFVPEQKHKVLEGKYNAETKALRNDVAEQRQVVDSLGAENEVLRQQVEALQEQTTNGPVDPDNPYNLPDELKDMPEVVEIAQRVNQKETQKVVELQNKMESYEKRMAKDQENRFWQDVDQLMPEWRDVNDSEGFLFYLDETVPELGMTRSDLLQDARNQRDVHRVKAIFDNYLARQQGQEPMTPTVASQVTPLPQANAGTEQVPEFIPSSEANEIMDRIISGQFSSSEEKEFQQKRLNDAMREGRIDYER